MINITVANFDGALIHFRINKETKLKNLMDIYCEKLEVPRFDVAFVYERSKINEEHTVESLDIRDGDVIKSFLESELIDIKVTDLYGVAIQFRIKRKTKLKKMMDMYCKRCKIPRSQARFSYNGSTIKDEDTAESLDMQESCNIEFTHALEGYEFC